MLILRREGWTFKHLALKYHCNPTTIMRTCNDEGLISSKIKEIKIYPIIVFRRVTMLDGERINPGKTYAQYLEAQKLKQSKQENTKGIL